MRLIFVRHGQTDFNKNKIPQGQEIDVPLNSEGIRQVEEVARYLPDDIDDLRRSDLRRKVPTSR